MKKTVIFLALLTLGVTAFGAEFAVQAKVIRIEPTFSDHLNIRMDAAAGSCLANTWLFFFGAGATDAEKKSSIKSVYSGLLASMYAGKKVVVYGNDQDCRITQVHLLNE